MLSKALVVGLASLLLLAAPSAAAPDRSGAVGRDAVEHTWAGKTASGFVYGSDVSSKVPACTNGVFACDQTLLEVRDGGKLTVRIVGEGIQGQDTMTDLDLHVYKSDAQGTMGQLLGEATSPAADETVTLTKLPAGHYLVYVDWYLGAGSYKGTAKLVPTPLPTQ